jgi:hypothetical protein
MYSISVKVDVDWRSMDQKLDLAVRKKMHETGRKMRSQAKRYTRRRTGALRRSIEYDVRKIPVGYAIDLSSNMPYASFYHDGTRPHVIAARPGKKLRFVRRGNVVYARAVNHPGARGRYNLSRAMRVVLAKSR